MVENGWYLLCPNCRRLLNTGWFELYSVITYKYYAMDLNGILWDEDKKIYDEDLIKIGHSCGFYTDEYEIIEFRILIRNNKIEDYGYYWERHIDELIEIAKELGLEIELDKDDGQEELSLDIWIEL